MTLSVAVGDFWEGVIEYGKVRVVTVRATEVEYVWNGECYVIPLQDFLERFMPAAGRAMTEPKRGVVSFWAMTVLATIALAGPGWYFFLMLTAVTLWHGLLVYLWSERERW